MKCTGIGHPFIEGGAFAKASVDLYECSVCVLQCLSAVCEDSACIEVRTADRVKAKSVEVNAICATCSVTCFAIQDHQYSMCGGMSTSNRCEARK